MTDEAHKPDDEAPKAEAALSLWFVKAGGAPMAPVQLRTDITTKEAVAAAVRVLEEREQAQRRRRAEARAGRAGR